MNKAAIIQTAVCKVEDNVHVFESPLLPDCIGAAETEKEAWEHFTHHVDTAYAAYLEGRLTGMYDRPGRPAKHRESLTLRVQLVTKDGIARLAEQKGCSQGEIADYLLAFWEAKHASAATKTKKPAIEKRSRVKPTARTKRRA